MMDQAKTININNPGTIVEKAEIQADQVAGRDIHNHKHELKQIVKDAELVFNKVNTASYREGNYTPPNFTNELLERVLDKSMLVVSGGQGFDKGSFVRHLAHLIESKNREYDLREIQINNESKGIYRDLLEGDDNLVYILDQLHPQHFDYDLEKFSRIARQKNLYLLITTDISIESWNLLEHTQYQFSYIIPTQEIYCSEILSKHLSSTLTSHKDQLKKKLPLKLEDVLEGQLFGKSFSQIAEGLSTPENISFLVSLLCREEEEITIGRFEEICIEVTNANQTLVTKWFRTLDDKQKLIALGVSLLEGMYDDQFFGVMKGIVKSFWKHSDPTLLALDYIDLEFLWDYFKLEETNGNKKIVKNRFPNQRTDIIKAAWFTHRRHILAILPVLVNEVHNSVEEKASNWEKYGTRQRQMNIRLAIGTTIGDVGLVSVPSVENALIELAAQENSTLQRVAAKSLARWREFDGDEQLFSTLKDWLEDERIQNLLNDFLAKRTSNDSINIGSKASSYLKATAVLALNYSANYDSPNHLNPEIVSLIKEIAVENDPLVRTRIQEALPRIIHHHILQLKDILVEDLMKHDDLSYTISDGLARAYADYPKDLRSTLYGWLEGCLASSSESNQRQKFTYRDKVLVTVFETLQKVEFTNTEKDVIKLEEVYRCLLKFIENEKRASVRDVLFQTLGKIVSLDWEKAEKYLSKIFSKDNLHELDEVVNKFTIIYLIQRQNLEGGEHTIHWNDDDYPVWLAYKERPFTEIETIMLEWMDKGDLVLMQISTLSFLAFAKIFEEEEWDSIEKLKVELWEQRAIRKRNEARQLDAIRSIKTDTLTIQTPIIPLFTRIYIFFLLLFQPENRKVTLKAILSMLYKYPSFKKRHLYIVFSKWVRSSETTTKKLLKWLMKILG